MAELQTISKRTVDGLSAGDKDAVFRDRELPGFGVWTRAGVPRSGVWPSRETRVRSCPGSIGESSGGAASDNR